MSHRKVERLQFFYKSCLRYRRTKSFHMSIRIAVISFSHESTLHGLCVHSQLCLLYSRASISLMKCQIWTKKKGQLKKVSLLGSHCRSRFSRKLLRLRNDCTTPALEKKKNFMRINSKCFTWFCLSALWTLLKFKLANNKKKH